MREQSVRAPRKTPGAKPRLRPQRQTRAPWPGGTSWPRSGPTWRSEAAKEQPRTETGLFQPVRQHSVSAPAISKHPEAKAKAAASKTNPGAVARGDKLAKERPDLADMVRLGLMKPAEAHRQMKRDAVKAKTCALPEGTYRIIFADPPWKYGEGRTGDLMTATGALHHYPQRLYGLRAWATPCAQGSLIGA